MIGRAKRIAAQVARSLRDPLVVATVPHDLRAALADVGAEFVELNQRMEVIEDRLNIERKPDAGK